MNPWIGLCTHSLHVQEQKATAVVSSRAPPCGLSWQMGICHFHSVSLLFHTLMDSFELYILQRQFQKLADISAQAWEKRASSACTPTHTVCVYIHTGLDYEFISCHCLGKWERTNSEKPLHSLYCCSQCLGAFLVFRKWKKESIKKVPV